MYSVIYDTFYRNKFIGKSRMCDNFDSAAEAAHEATARLLPHDGFSFYWRVEKIPTLADILSSVKGGVTYV